MNRTATPKGFTIVELLVVIVVIAILAAITAVVYGNVRERARTAALQADLNQVSKQFDLYASTAGRYPVTLAEASSMNIKFSISPAGSNVLWCGNESGYAIFARIAPAAKDGLVYISSKGLSNTSPNWSSAPNTDWYWDTGPLCSYVSLPVKGWGSSWVSGG